MSILYHPVHGIDEYRRDHPWRKPNPGMILTGDLLGLDPAHCAIVGAKMSDIEAGAAEGLGGLRILVGSRAANRGKHAPCHEVVANFAEALALLRSRIAPAASDCSSRHL